MLAAFFFTIPAFATVDFEYEDLWYTHINYAGTPSDAKLIRCYHGNYNLREVEVPTMVNSKKYRLVVSVIDFCAFSEDTVLVSIKLPAGLTKIESSAFSHCTSLASMTIPVSCHEIADNAFKGCNALSTIIVSFPNRGYAAYSEYDVCKFITRLDKVCPQKFNLRFEINIHKSAKEYIMNHVTELNKSRQNKIGLYL